MILRHAAALTLVGWYLIIAPSTKERQFDTDAPLSKWITLRSFDTAAECEHDRATGFFAVLTKDNPKLSLASLCISSDDPRLKEK